MEDVQTGSFRNVAKYKLEQVKDDLESANYCWEQESIKQQITEHIIRVFVQ